MASTLCLTAAATLAACGDAQPPSEAAAESLLSSATLHFGGSAQDTSANRSDMEALGVSAQRAERTNFDGFGGNMNNISSRNLIHARTSCNAAAGITSQVAVMAPNQGNANGYCTGACSASDESCYCGLAGLRYHAKSLGDLLGDVSGPIYVRYGKEFDQDFDPNDLSHRCGAAWLVTNNGGFCTNVGDEYIAEWNAVRDGFAASRSASSIKMTWCPTASLFQLYGREVPSPGSPNPQFFWPGTSRVDVIGPDGYNGKKVANATPQGAFGQYSDFAARIGRPFLISETGVVRTGNNVDRSCSTHDDSCWWYDLFTFLRSSPAQVVAVGGFWENNAGFGDTTLDAAQAHAVENTFLGKDGVAAVQHAYPAGCGY